MFISPVSARHLHQQRSSKAANKFVFARKFSCHSGIFLLLHTCLLLFSTSLHILFASASLPPRRARWLDVCTHRNDAIQGLRRTGTEDSVMICFAAEPSSDEQRRYSVPELPSDRKKKYLSIVLITASQYLFSYSLGIV